MKLLLEKWRQYLNEQDRSVEEKIEDMWYSPSQGAREQAQAIADTLNLDIKGLRVWKIHLPLGTGRQLDSFWTFAEAEAIIDHLNKNTTDEYYIKDYLVTNEDAFGKPSTIRTAIKEPPDFEKLSRNDMRWWSRAQTRAFDDAAEAVVPGRFEEGGRYQIDVDRIDRYYK